MMESDSFGGCFEVERRVMWWAFKHLPQEAERIATFNFGRRFEHCICVASLTTLCHLMSIATR
jgi:hypothetical protein